MTISFPLVKKLIIYVWLSLVIAFIAYGALNPHLLNEKNLVDFFFKFEGYIWLVYILICIVSGFFLVPNTPFIIAGTILFPQQLLAVVAVSLFNAIFGATFLYYFANWMGIGDTLKKKYPEKMEQIKVALNKPYAIFLVVLWSFLPIVPTDLIAYVARVVGMRYRLLILGIILGELPLILLAVYFTSYFTQ